MILLFAQTATELSNRCWRRELDSSKEIAGRRGGVETRAGRLAKATGVPCPGLIWVAGEVEADRLCGDGVVVAAEGVVWRGDLTAVEGASRGQVTVERVEYRGDVTAAEGVLWGDMNAAVEVWRGDTVAADGPRRG